MFKTWIFNDIHTLTLSSSHISPHPRAFLCPYFTSERNCSARPFCLTAQRPQARWWHKPRTTWITKPFKPMARCMKSASSCNLPWPWMVPYGPTFSTTPNQKNKKMLSNVVPFWCFFFNKKSHVRSPAVLDPTLVTGTGRPSSRSPQLSRPPPGPPPAILRRAAPSPHPRPPAARTSNASAAPRRTAEPKPLGSLRRSPTWPWVDSGWTLGL